MLFSDMHFGTIFGGKFCEVLGWCSFCIVGASYEEVKALGCAATANLAFYLVTIEPDVTKSVLKH